jgi:hypothetical protein
LSTQKTCNPVKLSQCPLKRSLQIQWVIWVLQTKLVQIYTPKWIYLLKLILKFYLVNRKDGNYTIIIYSIRESPVRLN